MIAGEGIKLNLGGTRQRYVTAGRAPMDAIRVHRSMQATRASHN